MDISNITRRPITRLDSKTSANLVVPSFRRDCHDRAHQLGRQEFQNGIFMFGHTQTDIEWNAANPPVPNESGVMIPVPRPEPPVYPLQLAANAATAAIEVYKERKLKFSVYQNAMTTLKDEILIALGDIIFKETSNLDVGHANQNFSPKLEIVKFC